MTKGKFRFDLAEIAKDGWMVSSQIEDKFNGALDKAIRKAFEENLPEHFEVEYSVEEALSEYIPGLFKWLIEEKLSVFLTKPKSHGDLGLNIFGEAGFSFSFDLGEVLINESNALDGGSKAMADWLRRVADKVEAANIPDPRKDD